MKAFDDYIRKHTQEDLDLPDGLSWEAMNIPLPTQSKKRRRYRWLIVLCIGALIGTCTSQFFMSNDYVNAEGNTHQTVSHSHTASADQGIKTDPITKENRQNALDNAELKEINISTSENIDRIKQDIIHNTHQNSSSIRIKDKDHTFHEFSQSNNISLKKHKMDHEDVVTTTIMPSLNTNKQKTINEIERTLTPSLLTLNLIPQYVQHDTGPQIVHNQSTIIEQKESTPSNLSVYLGAGINQSSISYRNGPQADVLNDAESSRNGYSYQLGIRYRLADDFFLMSTLYYQDLRSYIRYSENLGTEIVSPTTKITRIRNIGHNNSIKFAGIQLGVGKEIPFNNRWGTQVTASFISAYQLSADGRTLNESLSIIDLENHRTQERWNLGLQINAGLYVQATSKWKLISTIGYQHSFNSLEFDNNTTLQIVPKSIDFTIGIDRRF